MFTKKSSQKESKSDIKNIITIDAYENKYYIYSSDKFKPLRKLTYNPANFTSSYVANKDLIIATVNISRNIPEEDIPSLLEIKAYEELGLDMAVDYIIHYEESETSDEERLFHIFVVNPNDLEELFLPIKEQTKYIDLITPAPLLYKSLYKKEILSDNAVHCFVYFTRYDAFITFYRNGQYLYSKSIDYSLEQIYEKFCELIGEKIDEKEFFSVLETEGLKTTKNEYQENLMKIFGEIFITINDVIIYVKRAYQLDSIDHLFIGSVNGPINGLEEYSQNYLGLQSSDMNFDYHIKTDEWYIDQLQYLMLMTSFEYMENEDFVVNLTLFPRPPSFINRPGGQFLIAIFAAISIALAYPLMYLVGSYLNDAKIVTLKPEDQRLSAEAAKYRKIISQKLGEIKVLDEKIKHLSETYQAKTKTLTQIYDKKVNYKLKSGVYHQIAEDLAKLGVHVDNIQTENNTVWLSLVSPNDRKMTELIKYISDKHFDDIDTIDIVKIEKDPQSEYYRGVLKVGLR